MPPCGGGSGSLARRVADWLLRQHSAKQVSIDVVDYERPGEYATSEVTLSGFHQLDEVNGQYDLAIASAILEHIPDVHAVMSRLFALVAPGGFFYARTPFMLPLARLVRGLDLTYPGHVHDMGCDFWNQVVQLFGLDAVVVSSAPSPVETGLATNPVRTMAAFLLKLPAHLEGRMLPQTRKHRWWKYVGGWEVVLHFGGANEAVRGSGAKH